jgi:hypothetical protein
VKQGKMFQAEGLGWRLAVRVHGGAP